MSINALKEFMIHFHTFRNVDLINQGLYQIRSRIYYTDKNTKIYAIPYFFSDSKSVENLLKNEENNIRPHNIIPNHISENNWEYVSKTFLIRYYDEEVEIDEFCYFRLELPSGLLKQKIIYHIEFELFFSDALLALESERNKNSNNVLNNVDFKSASLQTSIINFDNECPGYIESFNPVIYGDSFFSILNSSIHMIILDYKLRLNNFIAYSSNGITQTGEKDSDKDNNRASSTKKGKNIGSKALLKEENTLATVNYNSTSKILNDKNIDINFISNNIKVNIGKNNLNIGNKSNSEKKIETDFNFNKKASSDNVTSLIQFFNHEKLIKITDANLTTEIIDDLYDRYVISLIKNYFAVRKKYERLMNKLIDDKIKSEFPFFIVKNKKMKKCFIKKAIYQ